MDGGNDGTMSDAAPNLDLARNVVRMEAERIAAMVDCVDEGFAAAARAVFGCPGTVVLTGVGKAGVIAQKISATLASTGTPSIFLHPVEALHGDLGRLRRDDVVIALSHSGRTDEILELVNHLQARGARLIAMTARADSPLARYADMALCYGNVEEACPLGLAPTASTACMLALGDALALTVMDMRRFSPEEFASFHPAGALGRSLLKVEEVMTSRPGQRLPVAAQTERVRDVLAACERLKRRAGAVLLVDEQGRLAGILTDGDFRRQVLADGDGTLLERPIGEVMVRDPKRIEAGELASKALAIMNRYRIDELPVVDAAGRPVGLLDVQDLVGLKALEDGRE